MATISYEELNKHFNPSTKELNLSLYGSLKDIELERIISFCRFYDVHVLELFGNMIDDAGAKNLAANLKGTNIHTLALSGNMIGDAGAKDLTANLEGTNIHTLNLSWNEIGDAGAKDLASGLKDSNVTEVIGVKHPELGKVLEENRSRLEASYIAIGRGLAKFTNMSGMGPELILYMLQWLPIAANSETIKILSFSDTVTPKLGLDTKASYKVCDAFQYVDWYKSQGWQQTDSINSYLKGWLQTGSILSGQEAHLNGNTRLIRTIARDTPHLFFNQPIKSTHAEPANNESSLTTATFTPRICGRSCG